MTGTERLYLVCPACEHVEAATERVDCPACGSRRTYLNHAPALPDAADERAVKLDPGDENGSGGGSGDGDGDGGVRSDPDAESEAESGSESESEPKQE